MNAPAPPRLCPGRFEILRSWKLGLLTQPLEFARGVLKHREFGSARGLQKIGRVGSGLLRPGFFETQLQVLRDGCACG